MKIIPAIDLIDGKCVRLSQGDFSGSKIYNENPLELAKAFEDAGISNIHVVDLDGARSDTIINYKILELLATRTQLSIDFSGGIKKKEEVRLAFDCGASQITVGSVAVQNQEQMLDWLQHYGAEKIILGADCRKGKIVANGWLHTTEKEVIPFIQGYIKNGIQWCMVTDVQQDGMLSGPAISLYRQILSVTEKFKLIASGGVSNIQDLAALKALGCEGVIIGKAIYEGYIKLKELSCLC